MPLTLDMEEDQISAAQGRLRWYAFTAVNLRCGAAWEVNSEQLQHGDFHQAGAVHTVPTVTAVPVWHPPPSLNESAQLLLPLAVDFSTTRRTGLFHLWAGRIIPSAILWCGADETAATDQEQ